MLKNIITEMKNSLERPYNRMDVSEERVSEPEYGSIEIIQSKEQEEKKMRKKLAESQRPTK